MKRRAMIAAGTFASALALAGCQQDAKAPEPVRPVLSMVLEPSRSDGMVAVGVVEPQYKTNLAFRVLGRLTARPVSVGDLVSEGQTVGIIDPTALELAVRSAKAELTKAEAQLATATATGGAAADPHHNRRHHEADTGQCRAGAGRRRRVGGARTGQPGQGDRATGLCTDQGRFRRRRHRGRRRSRTGGLSRPRMSVTVARPDIREAVVDIGEDFPVPLEIDLPFTVGLQLLPAVQVEGKVREIAPQADPATRTAASPHRPEQSA